MPTDDTIIFTVTGKTRSGESVRIDAHEHGDDIRFSVNGQPCDVREAVKARSTLVAPVTEAWASQPSPVA